MWYIIIIALLIVLTIVFFNQRNNLISEKSDLKNQLVEKDKIIEIIENKKQQLEKYQCIVDADEKANEILSNANKEASELLKQARNELGQANAESDEIRREIDSLKERAEIRAENRLNSASIEAGKIINEANERAKEIAGDAYEALKKADSLEQTAKAMKNIIEGYGDQYIIPSYTLLDELADDYGHTQAGEELAKCRERMRLMIKNETAATCDYVERNRRETAIRFVLDAFNGKVDSILTLVKKNNYGTLQQKIRDAFSTVNYNGEAFRNAVITKEFLEVRLNELKWASTVQEIIFNEKEEQRLIKEQIREEEKARRDFEKAIKEAEKEEEMLKKAMEKVKRELSNANELQKEKYETQLKELEERLQLAEEKNQRALSMAQQTKTGHIYVVSNIGSFGENVYKIGMTRRLEPMDRVRELGDASVPFAFDVHAMILSDNAPGLEKELHKKFVRMQMNKVNPRKEFFRITLNDIKNELENRGIEAKWTMLAEAKEYRESLAIDKTFENHTLNEQDWERHTIQDIENDDNKENEEDEN